MPLTRPLALLLALLASGAPLAAQGTKVGVVDADRVIQVSKKGKAFMDSLQAFHRKKREEIETRVAVYEKAVKQAQAQASRMNAEQQRSAADRLERMKRDLQRQQEDAQREADQRLQAGLDRFRRELGPLIRRVAMQGGFHLVINLGHDSGVVYHHESIDITDAVIRAFDEQR